MSGITTHVLDTSLGAPGRGIKVSLQIKKAGGPWQDIDKKQTDSDGRVKDFALPKLESGSYRLSFEVGEYFSASKRQSFYANVPIEFNIENPSQHYHVPLLISPFGYSTYRGS